MMNVNMELNLLLKRRNCLKDTIEQIVLYVKEKNPLDRITLAAQKDKVSGLLNSVESLNEQITNGYFESEEKDDILSQHIKEETWFHSRITHFFGSETNKLEEARKNIPQVTTKSELLSSHYNVTPKLQCPVFDPESLSQDKLSFLNFYKEFENCVLSVKNKSLRLII